MKKLLPVLGFTLLMTACNTMPEQKADAIPLTQQTLSQPDTTGMAAFNAWKAQNELAGVNAYQQTQQTQSVPEKTKTVVKYVPAKQATTSKPVSKTNSSSNSASSPEPKSSGSSAGSGSGSTDNESGETAQVEKKEGWSKAAKGAVIGGVAGAAGGAVINKKNRVAGAVIGGVIGAAGGYGIGRGMDKKDGRIDYSTIIN
ncbi:MAG TPA: glycine zipper domain-containing protein [Flavisolibacter sp.]|nr:glycine zipper domain-containing protein [Flavisolibacter sp.]